MKECPNCKKLFTDELSYCLYDGVTLTEYMKGVDDSARTEAAYDVSRADPTQVLATPSIPITQSSIKIGPIPARSRSKLPYFAIGALALVCIILSVALVVLNFDRLNPTSETKARIGNDIKSTPMPSSMASMNGSPSNSANKAVNQTADPPVAANRTAEQPPTILSPNGKWKGEWSTPAGTFLDIEVDFSKNSDNDVEGKIYWTLRRTVRPDKMDKIGLSATEYVHGKFDPETGVILMSGYKKDDPNDVLVMLDNYRLTISSDGTKLTGIARNGGKWNGRLKLTR